MDTPHGWTPDEEDNFQRDMQMAPGYREWFHGMSREMGAPPNLNDRDFNYRQGWRSGMTPEAYEFDTVPHWLTTTPGGRYLKGPNHPTRWMEPFMQATGGVDPHAAGAEDWRRAAAAGPKALPTIPAFPMPREEPPASPLASIFAPTSRRPGEPQE